MTVASDFWRESCPAVSMVETSASRAIPDESDNVSPNGPFRDVFGRFRRHTEITLMAAVPGHRRARLL